MAALYFNEVDSSDRPPSLNHALLRNTLNQHFVLTVERYRIWRPSHLLLWSFRVRNWGRAAQKAPVNITAHCTIHVISTILYMTWFRYVFRANLKIRDSNALQLLNEDHVPSDVAGAIPEPFRDLSLAHV